MSCCDNKPPTPPAPTPTPPPVQTCPPNCTLTASWVDTQAYCGDNVRLQATITPAPPDGPATVQVLLVVPGGTPSTVATINTTVTGGHINATWVAKAASASWRTDQMQFRVHVPGATVTGTSSNSFMFRQRPTTSWVLRDVNHPTSTGFAPIIELHDARLEADRVHYSLKLRLYGAPFTAAKQTDSKSRIETIWNDGFTSKKFHRTRCGRGQACDCLFDCCKASYRLDVNFVASGEHLAVEIVASPNPAAPLHSHTSRAHCDWADPPIAVTTTYAHEVGHMLGQFDEYAGGGNDGDTPPVQPVNPPVVNLMSSANITVLLNRHYRWALAFLNSNAGGDPYEIIPP